MSDLLTSLRGNERSWANRLFLGKNERFAPKTDEQIPSPAGARAPLILWKKEVNYPVKNLNESVLPFVFQHVPGIKKPKIVVFVLPDVESLL